MSKKDALWQKLIDEEKLRLSSRPAQELILMGAATPKVIQSGKTIIEYVVWHHIHSEDVKYSSEEEAHKLSAQIDREFGIRRPQRIHHSFVLQATRKLPFGFYNNYLAGFSLDENGKVIPVSDEVISCYD